MSHNMNDELERYESRQDVQDFIHLLRTADLTDLLEPHEPSSQIRTWLRQVPLRSVVTSSLLLALCIPTVLYFIERPPDTAPPLESPVRGVPDGVRGIAERSPDEFLAPEELAKNALRKQYVKAFEERKLSPLSGKKALGEQWRAYLTDLFAKSFRLSVFLEIDNGAVTSVNSKHIQIPFLQVITTLDAEDSPGAFLLIPPQGDTGLGRQGFRGALQ